MKSARWACTQPAKQRKANGGFIKIHANAESKNIELDPFLMA